MRGAWFPDAFVGRMANLQRFVAGEDQALVASVEDAWTTMALVEAAFEFEREARDGAGRASLNDAGARQTAVGRDVSRYAARLSRNSALIFAMVFVPLAPDCSASLTTRDAASWKGMYPSWRGRSHEPSSVRRVAR